MQRILTRYIILFLVGSVAFAALFAYLGYRRFHEEGPLTTDAAYLLPKGQTLSSAAVQLEAQGMIYDARLFQLGGRLAGDDRKLKAGEYMIPAGTSMRQLLGILTSGQVIQHPITFVEGWSSAQLIELLKVQDALGQDIPPIAEGSLLPDTYFFERGTSATELLNRMRQKQQALIETLWANRQPGLPLKTPQEAIILASIVEKETAVEHERAHIAGVFINRLRKNMRLQSDPTVAYGLTNGLSLDRPLSRKDLKTDHPYNTYVIRGLPPAPICHPGRRSLEAVLQPMKTDDLYFVANGTGGHSFATTLDEHNKNVRHWRSIEREAAKAATSAGSAAEASPQSRSVTD